MRYQRKSIAKLLPKNTSSEKWKFVFEEGNESFLDPQIMSLKNKSIEKGERPSYNKIKILLKSLLTMVFGIFQ
jgi:hypothetical protein